MKFEIKSRWNASVLFSLETDSMKLCVEAAVKSRADLSGADLYGAYLYGAYLSGANLSGANLSDADLSGAYLSDAYLSGAYLYGANLSDADLSGADLYGAYLYGAYLYGANLSGAYLSGADLYGAYLYGANLSGANLYGANLYGANLYGANLYGAYLSGADGEKITAVGERPFLTIGPLGSRVAYLQVWLTDAGVYVRAGCFWNTLTEFKKAVKETHKANVHAKEYAAAIKLIETHAKLWTPKPERASSRRGKQP